MNKPLPCNQKWDDMLPSDGGRICTGCGKLVTDFRKYKWADIEKVHLSNPIPTCGIYDDKQLNYWGQQVPSDKFGCSKLVHLSAALLTLTQLLPTDLKAQTKTTTTVVTPKQTGQAKNTTSTPTKKFVSGTVVRQLADSTKLPVKNADIIIKCDEARFNTIVRTDSGRFSIDITDKFELLPSYFKVYVNHPDFLLETIAIDKNNLHPLDITLSDVTVTGKQNE